MLLTPRSVQPAESRSQTVNSSRERSERGTAAEPLSGPILRSQIHRFTDSQMCTSGAEIFRFAVLQMYRFAGPQIWSSLFANESLIRDSSPSLAYHWTQLASADELNSARESHANLQICRRFTRDKQRSRFSDFADFQSCACKAPPSSSSEFQICRLTAISCLI